MPQVVTLIIL